MRPEPIHPEQLPVVLSHRRVECIRPAPACDAPTAPACDPVVADPRSAPIPFHRYLEKHNREDRADTSRTTIARTDVDHRRAETACRGVGSGVSRARLLMAYARQQSSGPVMDVTA